MGHLFGSVGKDEDQPQDYADHSADAAAAAGVGYVGLHYVVGNKFGELERMSVERNRERVRAVVQADGQLTMLGQDWSEWDETYAYMVSRDPAYLAANLNVRTFETLGWIW